jgi:hypothetical protein
MICALRQRPEIQEVLRRQVTCFFRVPAVELQRNPGQNICWDFSISSRRSRSLLSMNINEGGFYKEAQAIWRRWDWEYPLFIHRNGQNKWLKIPGASGFQ